VSLPENYFFAGAAGAAGAVAVTVDVTADFVAGAEAGFWQPTTKSATTARAAMIAEIFFMFSPLSS
jgi:hypothetical protein